VKALRGKCEVRSKLGQGTTFDVWIPRADPTQNAKSVHHEELTIAEVIPR